MAAITDFLARDHDRLDAYFTKACADPSRVDREPYEAFRRGLLRHVGMEELILIPAAKRLSGAAVSLAARTRLDHGALTALLIPSPTPAIMAAIRAILVPHNVMEEEADGLYAQCERALGAEAGSVLERLKNAPDIPPAAHVDGPHVVDSMRRALAAAGYADLGRNL